MTGQSEIRFTQLVKKSGAPQVVALWSDPKKDEAFMKLVKQRRILTVIQKPTGTKKDFGFIGFHPQPFAAFLEFPKPLQENDEVRVIGVKYDLLQEQKIKAGERYEPPEPKPPPKPPMEAKEFSVTIVRRSAIKVKVNVRAKNSVEAKAKALEEVRAQPYSPSESEIVVSVLSLKQLSKG